MYLCCINSPCVNIHTFSFTFAFDNNYTYLYIYSQINIEVHLISDSLRLYSVSILKNHVCVLFTTLASNYNQYKTARSFGFCSRQKLDCHETTDTTEYHLVVHNVSIICTYLRLMTSHHQPECALFLRWSHRKSVAVINDWHVVSHWIQQPLSDLQNNSSSKQPPTPPQVLYSRYGLYHGQAHHDRAGSMVLPVFWQPTDTVVAISQDLDPQLMIFLTQYMRFSQRDGPKNIP